MTTSLKTGLLGLLGATMLSTHGVAQQPLPTPTVAQALQADQRQGQYVELNGARIFYQVAGQGTPLLLIHGFPLDGELFEGQLTGLSSQFKVITPDLRGFGKSTTPNAKGSIVTYAHDIIALMDHLGIKKAIIGGHSMGGQITLELYREAPERFLGMILIDTNAMPASIVEQAQWPAFGVQAQRKGVPSIVPIITPQMLTGVERMANLSGTTEMMDILAEASVNGVKGGGQALATRPDYTGLLPTIAVPTLVLVGLDDPIYSFEVSEMMKAAIPSSKLVIIPQAEHASIFEQRPASNLAIARFAEQLPFTAN
jgi:pimeloyl-ACP methyl ester carboxylesterase